MAKLAHNLNSRGWKSLGSIGKGGQGDVELVERIGSSDGQKYAMKFLNGRGGIKAQERFRQELATLSQVTHKRIINIIEYSKSEDEFQYYVMEYHDGFQSLKRRMDGNKNPFYRNPLKAIDGFIEIVEALGECEKLGIVHRDLSPANVLVSDEGRIILIDFGLCHVDDGNLVTMTGEAVGTPHYRPPECSGYSTEPITSKADLYSAGKILWSMVTNQTAFDREKPVFNNLSLSNILADIPSSWHLHHIFEGSIRHEPRNRFANTSRALAKAQLVRRLILGGFKTLEEVASDTCHVCGVGSYGVPAPQYQDAVSKFMQYIRPISGSIAVCNYCFCADIKAVAAQKLALENRKKLE